MPLLRPYGDRNAHLGTSTPEISQKTSFFHFDKCDVALYIISKNGENLQYRNGVPTELALHSIKCEKCLGRREESKTAQEFISVQIHQDLLKDLNAWFKKEFPNQKFDQCLLLMKKEILFWRSEDKRKKHLKGLDK